MRHILFLFLDGIGLGEADPQINPFAIAELPTLHGLLNGQRLLRSTPATDNGQASFIPTDAGLGVAGPPQSATGQATILTGLNVPALVGGHWGPKPNEAVSNILRRENIFKTLIRRGQTTTLINAYPQRYFEAITRGKRMYSAIPMAVDAAGIPLMTVDDLRAGRAFSADFTGEGWHGELGYTDTPVYTLAEAGAKLAEVSRQRSFTFFEHWITDLVGHRGTVEEGAKMLERFDAMLGGLLANWDDDGLIIITSDHGNLEDLSHSHHTINKVPTLIIGRNRNAIPFIVDLTGFVPAILNYLAG
ncbi:MAG: alkaline phosphatase family protein [Chloroflexi bacterium]|nr:alkaline phosphatase family protein [Chloroflexota bacterium]